jgi:DMSO reductase anchor subunit
MASVGIILAVGLVFSIWHLGRPLRSPLALARVGRSRLSDEVMVVGIAVGASLLAVFLPVGHSLFPVVTVVAMLSSVAVLLALGLVYRLPGQLTWVGLTPIHPLVLGAGFGLTVLLGVLPDGTQARAEFLILVILMVDGLFVWERARRINRALLGGTSSHPNLMAQRGNAFVLRILLGILLPAVALLSGWRELAGLSLFLNLFLDRFLFYGLAVREDTEAEVRKVEAALRAGIESLPGLSNSTASSIRADER